MEPAATPGGRQLRLFWTALRGADVGAVLGISVAFSLARPSRWGAPPSDVPPLMPFDLGIAIGCVAGGALAGALLGLLRDRMRSRLGGVAMGVVSLLAGTALLRIAMLHALPLSLPSVLVPLASALAIGALAGLITHDVTMMAREREEDADLPASSLVHRLVLWSRTPSARTRRRRRAVAGRPFPEPWLPLLRAAVPVYDRLPEDDQRRLREHVLVFLDEKSFEGCGGLELTDQVRVTIAGQACLLVLRQEDLYPGLRSILIYPGSYQPGESRGGHGELVTPKNARQGESWGHGTVVLAWDGVMQGAREPSDGQNLVLHEFAHQLDQDDGTADGQPFLSELSAYRSWSRVMQATYRDHQRRSRAGRARVMDEYGARNPAEFFAVATEAFFERPGELRELYPELYRELARYYRLDPAGWPGAPVVR